MSRKGTKAKGELDGAEPIELPPLHKLTIGVVEPKEDASGLSKEGADTGVLMELGTQADWEARYSALMNYYINTRRYSHYDARL